MFKRQTSGSVVCTSCGSLVGVREEKCFNCGRRNPGMWGLAPLLRMLGGHIIAPGNSKTLGTIIGAGAGALLGRAIDDGDVVCR